MSLIYIALQLHKLTNGGTSKYYTESVPGSSCCASCFGRIGLPQQRCVGGCLPCSHSCISESTSFQK